MKTMIIVLQFFFNPLSTVINIIIVSIIPYLKSLLFLMIIKYFYHMCSTETFPKKTIKNLELKLQWQCAGLLGSFLKLQKAANLQGSSLID